MKNTLTKILLFLSLGFVPLLAYATNTDVANFVNTSSQYLTVADHANLRVDDGWTVGFWMRDSAAPSGANVIMMGQRDGENGWYIGQSVTNCYIVVSTGSGSFSGATSNVNHCDNTWKHIKVYFNGANTKLYVNNVLEATLSANAITAPSTALFVGSNELHNNTDAMYSGDMDDLRFYPTEWDGSDYNCQLTSETGLNAHWNFDDGTTPANLYDATGTGNNLTNVNTVTFPGTSLPFTNDCAAAGGASRVFSDALIFE